MTTLTDEEQALVGAIVLTGMPAPGARLAAEVGIDFHRHTACKYGLVGKVAMQFGKGPFGGMSVRSSLLLRGFLPMRASGALADVRQVFQAKDAVWVLVHNAPADCVVDRLLQPSLPSTDDDKSSGSGTGAFVLQPLSQAGIVVCFGSDLFSRIKGRAIVQACSDCQVALSDIDTDHVLMGFGRGVCHLKFKGHEQVKLLAGLVIPQLCCPKVGAVLQESQMLLIARVGDHDSPIQGEDAHLLLWFQTVVAVVVVGQRRRDILGWLIQTLVAFLGETRLARSVILLHLRPQRFVGRSHLTGNITGHLGGQMIGGAHYCIGLLLQPLLVALLAMRKCVAAHSVQGIAVGQLRLAQGPELGRRCMQFQLGGDHLLHRTSVQCFTENAKCDICEQSLPPHAPDKDSPFLPRRERPGTSGSVG